MARCITCLQEREIRAQDRCTTCYGRYYYSPAFTLVARQNPVRHRLSEVNRETRTATCSICGPVGVTRVPDYRQREGWRCNTTRNRIKRNERARNRQTQMTKAA